MDYLIVNITIATMSVGAVEMTKYGVISIENYLLLKTTQEK